MSSAVFSLMVASQMHLSTEIASSYFNIWSTRLIMKADSILPGINLSSFLPPFLFWFNE